MLCFFLWQTMWCLISFSLLLLLCPAIIAINRYCCTVTQMCLPPCDLIDCSTQASLPFTISQSLLKLMSIESVMPSNHLILCCPLSLLPSTFLIIRVVSNELALHIRWPKYWCFSFSISPFNEYSGLISFRVDWFDLLVVNRYWVGGKVFVAQTLNFKSL